MVDNGVAKVVVEFLKVRVQRTGTATELVPNTTATALAKQFMQICRFLFFLFCVLYVFFCCLHVSAAKQFASFVLRCGILELTVGYGNLSIFARLYKDVTIGYLLMCIHLYSLCSFLLVPPFLQVSHSSVGEYIPVCAVLPRL